MKLFVFFILAFITLCAPARSQNLDPQETPDFHLDPNNNHPIKEKPDLETKTTLELTAYAGYSTYEMFQDNNVILGSVTGGLWVMGLGLGGFSHTHSREWGPAGYLGGPFIISYLYPVFSLIDGYSNNNGGKIEGAWFGIGSDALITFLLLSDNRSDPKRVSDIKPVFGPGYSGLVWSKSF